MGDPPVARHLRRRVRSVASRWRSTTRPGGAFVVEMVPEADVQNAVSLNSALDDGLAHRRPGARRPAHRRPSATAGLPRRRPLVHRRARRPLDDGPGRAAAARRSPSAARGRSAPGSRYVRRVPDLWIPLVMMAIVGTLAFNFQVVFPLFVTAHVRRRRRRPSRCCSRSSASVRSSARCRPRGARRITIRHIVVASAVVRRRRCSLLGGHAEPGVAFPIGLLVGLREHRVPDRVDRDRAGAGRARDAGPGARAAGDRVPRQHADRRPDRRLRQPGMGTARGHRARRVRLPVRGRLRLHRGTGAPTSAARSGKSITTRVDAPGRVAVSRPEEVRVVHAAQPPPRAAHPTHGYGRRRCGSFTRRSRHPERHIRPMEVRPEEVRVVHAAQPPPRAAHPTMDTAGGGAGRSRGAAATPSGTSDHGYGRRARPVLRASA